MAAISSSSLGTCNRARPGCSQRVCIAARQPAVRHRPVARVLECSSSSARALVPLVNPGRPLSRHGTSVFGRPLQQHAAPAPSASSPGRPVRQWVSATASWRGRKLVVSAVLTGAPPAETVETSSSGNSNSNSNGSNGAGSNGGSGSRHTSAELVELLERHMSVEPTLLQGELANGMRYVVLPNKLPPGRFEAHVEVHAGSVDERPDEQGIAHLVEHVTFLGSAQREQLLGTGARANAYTDFHHTVFHVHAPILNGTTKKPMLEQVFSALREIAFRPQFLPERIEKERLAVLAEAQMMNTIEYRVDCQLLQYLHEENNLGFRFPIGKTEQVKTWPHSQLRDFWQRWYYPANVTLYVVGDFDRDVKDIEKLIETTFGVIAPGREVLAPPANGSANGKANGNGAVNKWINQSQVILGDLKRRQPVRPPVVHRQGCGPLAPGESGTPAVNIFRHPLLQHYMLSVFCKLPVMAMTQMQHLKQLLAMRIILAVFQSHINARYVEGRPAFLSIELDISDSGREGCAVSTLTVTAEPCNWAEATAVAVQEVRKLQRYGLTQGQFERYRQAILRDSSQLAEQANKIPSVDTLNFLMESIACGHTIMSHRDAHQAMVEMGGQLTLAEVNALAHSMLAFASHFGAEAELLEDAAQAPPGTYAYMGPTRATSVVACIPAYVDESGQSVSGGSSSVQRGAANAAGGHIDVDTVDLEALEKQAHKLDEFEVPEGAIRFDLPPAEIAAALSGTGLEVAPTVDVELPEHLVSEEQLAAMLEERRPTYVPLDGPGTSGSVFPVAHPASGITQRRLSNGMRINYCKTDHEPKAALMRLIVPGGRAAEKPTRGPDGFGAVVVGTRTLSESGKVGNWQREQVEVFCVSNLINCAIDADEENLVMDFHFAVEEGGMQAIFELVHLLLTQPFWDEAAFDRSKQSLLLSGKSVVKSLDRASTERIIEAMLGPDRHFREPTAEELEELTLDGVRSAVETLLQADRIEVNIVGDFDPEQLEVMMLNYLGTVPPPSPEKIAARDAWPLAYPTRFLSPPVDTRHQTWHLQDSDERACAYIAGPAPCRWGPFGVYDPLPPPPPTAVEARLAPPPSPLPRTAPAEARIAADAARRAHPLYASVTLMLLAEIINSRLFTTVRDTLGLTYDVSFEVTMFDRLRTGWFSVHVTSHPDKIHDALGASLSVLRNIAISPVTPRELARARTTILTRHESDLKDNVYWLGLMTHIQSPMVPLKTITCLRDLITAYNCATVEDIYDAYRQLKLGDEEVFTCVGTSGKSLPPAVDPRARLTFSEGDDDDVGDGPLSSSSAQYAGASNAAQGQLDPMSMITALLAAMNVGKGGGTPPPPPAGQQQQAVQQQQQSGRRQGPSPGGQA